MTGRGVAFQIAAVLLTVISAVAATGLARWLRQSADTPPEKKPPATKLPGGILEGWKSPDLVLIFTGQQLGYLEPCGCSQPQVGGLVRRYNLFRLLREKGWPVVPVDIGDVIQKSAPAGLPNIQGIIKYRYAMTAMKEMGYVGVGIGEADARNDLTAVLAEYALQFDSPRVVAGNLMDAEKRFPDQTKSWAFHEVKGPGVRVGVTSVVGPMVAGRITALGGRVRFAKAAPDLKNILKQMKKGDVHLPVLLYQGPFSRDPKGKATEASACAEAFPEFPVIACLSDHDEPDSHPTMVTNKAGGKTMVVTAGKKGKYLVAVGVWKPAKAGLPFTLKYERIEVTEEFDTPAGADKGHKVMDLLDAYTKELRDARPPYLKRYPQVRHQLQFMNPVKGLKNPSPVEYAGSGACKTCHEHAYDIWKKTPHSHAYQTLVKSKKRPHNRQHDPECIVCHTVGFGFQSGFQSEGDLPTWFTAEKAKGGKIRNEKEIIQHGLRDVGCESCHGPSLAHVRNSKDKEWQRRINPWKYMPAAKRNDAIDQFCQKCHDIDNDVHWVDKGDGKGGGFARKWPRIIHMNPKAPGEDVPEEKGKD
jgi:hypothetical protein